MDERNWCITLNLLFRAIQWVAVENAKDRIVNTNEFDGFPSDGVRAVECRIGDAEVGAVFLSSHYLGFGLPERRGG